MHFDMVQMFPVHLVHELAQCSTTQSSFPFEHSSLVLTTLQKSTSLSKQATGLIWKTISIVWFRVEQMSNFTSVVVALTDVV